MLLCVRVLDVTDPSLLQPTLLISKNMLHMRSLSSRKRWKTRLGGPSDSWLPGEDFKGFFEHGLIRNGTCSDNGECNKIRSLILRLL